MKCVICSLMGTVDPDDEKDAVYVVNGMSVCEGHMDSPLSRVEQMALTAIVDAEDAHVREQRRRQREWDERQSAYQLSERVANRERLRVL